MSTPCLNLARDIELGNKKEILDELKAIKLKINDFNPEFITLGCTHYENIQPEIKQVFPKAKIIAPAKFTAIRIIDYIKRHPEYRVGFHNFSLDVDNLS